VIPKQILDDRVIRVLLIAADEADHSLVTRLAEGFAHGAHGVDWANGYAAGLEAVRQDDHDVYLVDSELGSQSGLELIATCAQGNHCAPFILLTDHSDRDLDIEALDVGAADYLVKSTLDSDRLERSIRHALVHAQICAELIAAKEAADAATEAKTKFLANVSHDIRSPLNAIVGMTELVLRDQLTATQRESLDTVLVASESLMVLADRLVDVRRIESGQIDLNPEPFNLRDMVSGVVRIFGLRADQKNIVIKIETAPHLPERVVGDEARIQQVLIDLVSNAIKFTERGQILIRITHAADMGLLQIEVVDTGLGIPADLQDTIFDRSDVATTTTEGGTGLGVVRRIVTAMGGSVSVSSKVGKGSTFRFTAKVALPEDTLDGRTGADASHATVLVMSSSPEDRRTIETELEAGGLRTLVVGDIGAAAEAATRSAESGSSLDAIVLDTAYKPFEIAQTLRGLAGGLAPVTLVVPGGREGDDSRCREAGIKGYVSKPAEPGVLVDVVRASIAASRAGDTETLITSKTLGASRPVMRILVVDDVETNLRLTMRMLSERGHNVTGVRSGVEAIDKFEQWRFDTVLMDLQMPGLDGFDTTAAIRAEEVLQGISRTPIIALTGHTTTEERDRCRAAGMDGFLSKPVRPDALFAAVEQFGSTQRAA
jgi:two-component system sensor histidine kinase/response regulator